MKAILRQNHKLPKLNEESEQDKLRKLEENMETAKKIIDIESVDQEEIKYTQNVKDVEEVMQCRAKSIRYWTKARTQAEECGKCVNHIMWTEDQIKELDLHDKPHLTYNILVSKLMTLMGNEQLNRRVAKILAEYGNDDELIEILDGNYKSIIEREDLVRKLVKALADGLIYPTGGWIRRKIGYDEDYYLTVLYDLLDTFSVHPDEFRRLDLEDCKFVVLDDWMTIDEIVNLVGVSPLEDKEKYKNWKDMEDHLKDIVERHKDEGETVDYKKGDRYLVCQLEKRKETKVSLIKITNDKGFDEYITLTNEEAKKFRSSTRPFEFVKSISEKRLYKKTVVPYFLDVKLYEDKKNPKRRYSAFPSFSFDFNMPFAKQTSVVYILLDIQYRINKGMSQQVDLVTQILGSAWHVSQAEKNAIKTLKEKRGEPNIVVEYTTMKNKAERTQIQSIPEGVLATVNTDMTFVDEITNITPAMEGFSERSGETGVFYEKKVRQSLAATNPFFEILANLRENLAKDFVELVPDIYFEDDRILAVSGGPKSGLRREMVNINFKGNIERDIRNIKARAILDEGENTPNRLRQTFEENIAFTNVLAASGAKFEDIPWGLIIQHSEMRDKEGWMNFIRARQKIHSEIAAQVDANAEMEGIMNTVKGLSGSAA